MSEFLQIVTGSLKIVVIASLRDCSFPFLGLQNLMKLAQAFSTSQGFEVRDGFIGAMSRLDPCVYAVNEKIKI